MFVYGYILKGFKVIYLVQVYSDDHRQAWVCDACLVVFFFFFLLYELKKYFAEKNGLLLIILLWFSVIDLMVNVLFNFVRL